MSESIAALFKTLTQGVYVIGVANGEERNAFTAAWVMQVSFDPLLLALSINPQHSSYRLLKEGGAFSVNVLKHGQLDLAARFGDPARDNALSDGDWTMGRIGLPVLRDGGRSRIGGRKGRRRQAAGFARQASHLSRHRRPGWRLRAVSRRARGIMSVSALPTRSQSYRIVIASPLKSAFAISPTCRPESSRTAPFWLVSTIARTPPIMASPAPAAA
jgi:hypothetical protein